MAAAEPPKRVAVDVGNTRIKFGLFVAESELDAPNPGERALATPLSTLEIATSDGSLDELVEWLGAHLNEKTAWIVGSVNRPAAGRLIDWLRQRSLADRAMLLAAADLPLRVSLERPDMVGIDRLAAAVAANRIREPGRPAVIADLGSAMTIDLVTADGTFCGGAILPGISMAARALHEFTDLLPLLDVDTLANAPDAMGTSTAAAMHAGLFWGAVGATKELIAQLSASFDQEAQIFLTGGTGKWLAPHLGRSAEYREHLALVGIAHCDAGQS